MTTIYLAFKTGTFQVDLLHIPCYPVAIAERTLIHSEMMFKVHCPGYGCKLCLETHRKMHQPGLAHWVAYLVSPHFPWKRDVDHPRYTNTASAWTYVSLKLPNTDRIRQLLDEQVGKPLNKWGYYCNFVLPISFGIKKVNEKSLNRGSFTCAELFSTILIQQGLGDYFHYPPCQTYPYDLWQSTRRMPTALVFRHHPSDASQTKTEGQTVDSPPGLLEEKEKINRS